MFLRSLITILALISIDGCKNKTTEKKEEKFSKEKWAIRTDKEYTYRAQMLKDLMTYKLHGLKKEEVENLLGEPNKRDNGYIFYTVSANFIGNVPVPISTKTLVIKLTKDSTVEWRKIHG